MNLLVLRILNFKFIDSKLEFFKRRFRAFDGLVILTLTQNNYFELEFCCFGMNFLKKVFLSHKFLGKNNQLY